MEKFQIPLNPKREATTLIVEKCRFMSSKKVPLWLVFRNYDRAETEGIYVIFKSGDDLRQDILTLQMLRVMDKIWMENKLDLRLKPYRCVATGVNADGEGVGMIEVVLNSDTTSGIQAKFGGGAVGAFKLTPIYDYLVKNNLKENLELAVDNFVKSCAGYCVATYVLGIGDRHNGNIMVTGDGHLFHIDFGHFLGNFKWKFGYKRERTPFVFTPEMAYVMGGKHYQRSEQFREFNALCCTAFNELRKNVNPLEILFVLMVSAGMPELMSEGDISYMRNQLCLDRSDDQASAEFKGAINAAINATSRRFDNFLHIHKHEG